VIGPYDLVIMKKDYKLSAAARRRRVFDIAHRTTVSAMMGLTVLGMIGCGVFFYQFQQNKDDILKIRRKQLEDEISAKQAEALQSLSSSPSSS